MALIVLFSANGSPGVSTSALGLAMAWPRPSILADTDPTGARAVAAGYFHGGQLPTDDSIVDLAIAHRQGTLVEDLPRMLMRIPNTHIQLLNGPVRHNQARSLDSVWEPLAGVFKSLERNGQDVIVDAGRLGLEGSPYKLLAAADLALLVTHSTLPALVAAASWAPTLKDTFPRSGATTSLGALVVGPGRPFTAAEVSKTLQMPTVASLEWDPPSAEVFSLGAQPPRKFETARLSKSLRAAVQSIQSTLTSSRAAIDLAVGERSQP
ncbi:MAG TPA: hypothetical protein PLB21_08570 [Actinomycetota bacterium]|nr:hypothetical protein [Actinomycetota bacterium]